VPAVGPVTVRVRLEEEPLVVKLVPEDVEIDWAWAEGVLTVTLPSLHIHSVIAIGG